MGFSCKCHKKSGKEALPAKKGNHTGWRENTEIKKQTPPPQKQRHPQRLILGVLRQRETLMLSIKASTLLLISHIGHIICGGITTRIFLGASGFWHSSSFWIRVFFILFYFLFPLPLNLQSSQFIDRRSFYFICSNHIPTLCLCIRKQLRLVCCSVQVCWCVCTFACVHLDIPEDAGNNGEQV